VIAKSDLIILVVSSSLLGAAIYRWDQNTRSVNTSTVLANTQIVEPASIPVSTETTTSSVLTTPAVTTPVETSTITTAAVTPSVVEIVVTPEPAPVPARTFLTYVVRSGDSLSAIALANNTTVNTLRELNDISGTTIFVGQEIIYPANN